MWRERNSESNKNSGRSSKDKFYWPRVLRFNSSDGGGGEDVQYFTGRKQELLVNPSDLSSTVTFGDQAGTGSERSWVKTPTLWIIYETLHRSGYSSRRETVGMKMHIPTWAQNTSQCILDTPHLEPNAALCFYCLALFSAWTSSARCHSLSPLVKAPHSIHL